MATCFIYFGDQSFEKFKHVHNDTNLTNTNGFVFSTVKSNGDVHRINGLVCGWSFALYLTDEGIFYCGFKGSTPTEKPSLLLLSDKVSFNARHVEHLSAGFGKALLTSENKCFSVSDSDDTFVLCEIDTSSFQGKLKQVLTADNYDCMVTSEGLMYKLCNPNEKPELFSISLKVSEVACGKDHTILLTTSGQIYSFGHGSRGQLGLGEINIIEKPELIEALDGIQVKSISAGGWHSAAISVYEDLYTWGWNESGQLGRACRSSLSADADRSIKKEEMSLVPTLVDLPESKILKASLGSRHSAVLLENNTVLTFGWNGYGQLGRDVKTCSHIPTAIDLPQDLVIKDVQCSLWGTLVSVIQKNT